MPSLYKKVLFPGGDTAHLIQGLMVAAMVVPVWSGLDTRDSTEVFAGTFITLWVLAGTALFMHGAIGMLRAVGLAKWLTSGKWLRDRLDLP